MCKPDIDPNPRAEFEIRQRTMRILCHQLRDKCMPTPKDSAGNVIQEIVTIVEAIDEELDAILNLQHNAPAHSLEHPDYVNPGESPAT